MPIQQDFIYKSTSEKPIPTLEEWVDTLPGPQQLEFAMAKKRQLILRQRVIEQNKLTVVSHDTKDSWAHDSYVWDEKHASETPVEKRKKWDRVWLQYWSRYLKETGAQFEVVEKTID